MRTPDGQAGEERGRGSGEGIAGPGKGGRPASEGCSSLSPIGLPALAAGPAQRPAPGAPAIGGPAPDGAAKPLPSDAAGRGAPGWLARGLAPLRGPARALLGLLLLATLALAALGWRLQQGPLPLPFAAFALERLAADRGVPLRVGAVNLAWAGRRDGRALPLVLRLDALTMDGLPVRVAQVELTLAPGRLLRGEVVPGTVALRDPELTVELGPDGRPVLLPPPVAGAPAGDGDPLNDILRPLGPGGALEALREARITGARLRVLLPSRGLDAALEGTVLTLRRGDEGAVLAEGAGTVRLAGAAAPWTLEGRAAPVRDGVSPDAELRLALPPLNPAALAAAVPVLGPLAAVDAPASLEVGVRRAGGRTEARAALALEAGALVLPEGGRLFLRAASAALSATPDAVRLHHATLTLAPPAPDAAGRAADPREPSAAPARPGSARTVAPPVPTSPAPQAPAPQPAAPQPVPAAPAPAPRTAPPSAGPPRPAPPRVPAAPVPATPAPAPAAPAVPAPAAAPARSALAPSVPAPSVPVVPTITASGSAERSGRGWRAALDASLDRADIADLRHYWPGFLAPGGRGWITENLSAGLARDGRWHAELTAGPAGEAPKLEVLTGALEVDDAVLHWLRPVPPLEAVSGTVRFTSPEEIVVEARGRQRGTSVLVPQATARITGLGTSEAITIEGRASGPVADVVEVIRHPRLHLFDERPLDLKQPGGRLDASLSLAFPLLADLPAELIRVKVAARIADARLAALVAGQPLEHGALDLAVDNNGLRVTGTADLGPVRAAKLVVDLDFRPGPPSQVVSRQRVEGRVEARALEAFGLDLAGAATGPLSGAALAEQRRGGETRVALRGDLRDVRLELEPLGWSKPAGVPATGEATLVVRDEALRAVEDLRVESADLLARGRVAFGPASRFERLEINEARFGSSRVTAELEPPARPGDAWRVAARGPVLDLRGAVEKLLGPAAADGPPGSARTPLAIRGEFDRVLLRAGEARDLRAAFRLDPSGALRELAATGRHGERGSFDAAIVPRSGGGRELRARAENLGALLRAAGVLDELHGGRVTLTGSWRTDAPNAPLLGSAEMEDFSVRQLPGAAKLLQAVTVYGIADALRGPGLHFSRLHAPFALTAEALGLEDVQAYSASLGITAKGRILRGPETLEVSGTLVPAYFFNSLLGRLPLLGRLFSLEEGGGLFAANFRATGPVRDPSVSLNPLSALTPGVLRGLFGALNEPPAAAPARP